VTSIKLKKIYINLEVLSAISLKIRALWYLTPCNPVNIYQCFGDIFIDECGIISDVRGNRFF
jgi:hypothetical protein